MSAPDLTLAYVRGLFLSPCTGAADLAAAHVRGLCLDFGTSAAALTEAHVLGMCLSSRRRLHQGSQHHPASPHLKSH